MRLSDAVEEYVAVRRSLGASFKTDARTLRSFHRITGDLALENITTPMCRRYYAPDESRTTTCLKRYSTLKGLFRFAIARRWMTSSPLPTRPPRVTSAFRPHIYSTDEIRGLLDATDDLADPRTPLQAATFRTLLLLVYGAGLRAGEALRLCLADADLDRQVIQINESKFSKSRLLPVGDSLCSALARYRAQRCALAQPRGASSSFFATRTGNGLSLDRLERVFRRLRNAAGLVSPHLGVRSQPRLHDLRHTFAVHRLLDWYRAGEDVQQLLPWLSTYLGHRHLRNTQVYLTLTPALLEAASMRFAAYANVGVEASRG